MTEVVLRMEKKKCVMGRESERGKDVTEHISTLRLNLLVG